MKWEEMKLSSLCEKITDGTHIRPEYTSEGYVFLSSTNVKTGTINWENVKYISSQQHKNYQKRVSPKVGDLLLAKVVSFDRTRDPSLTTKESGLGKIVHGRIIEITPTKIPRLIGRRGSMINMIKRETGCNITVGQNGVVLVSGKTAELETLAIQVIFLIEQEAHMSGLTNRITEYMKKEKSV